MAGDRTVSVTLRAQVSQYLAEMNKASESTRKVGTEAEKLAQKKQTFELLGKAALGLGVAAAAGVALAVAKFAEYDAAMSDVRAATIDSAESVDQQAARMEKLGAAALEAGASTVFSATESANAIEELAKAGLKTSDILGGALKGSLDLAAAGNLGVARAAEISATALNQFELKGSEAAHVADILAAGAGKAMGSVDDLANGLKFVGPVANSMGVSIEETTGVLALFAQQGIIGEQAGTGLRGVLASLTSPSSLAAKEIEKLGIELYDSNGKFLGLENAAGEMSKAFTGMDDATRDASLGIIFGRETVTSATTLYKAGAEGVDEWTQAVDDSGYAAKVAEERLDNLKGDVEALGGAFDTALIQTGAAGNDVLRVMAQTLTGLIDAYNGSPEIVKGLTLAVGALTAVVGLAGAAFFLGAPKVVAFNDAVKTMGPGAQKAAGGLKNVAGVLGGPFGIALAAATVLLIAMNSEIQKGVPSTTEISNALATAADSAELFAAATKRGTMETDLFGNYAEGLKDLPALLDKASDGFIGWMSMTANDRGALDSIKKVGDALGTLAGTDLPGAAKAFKDLADSQDLTKKQQIELLNEMPGYREALIGIASEMELGADDATLLGLAMGTIKRPVEDNTDALAALEGKSQDTGDSIDDLAETIRGFADAALNTRDAARALEESYDALTESIEQNGTSLDIGTEQGRANEEALDAIAQAAKEAAASTLEQTGSQEQANAVLKSGRDRLIEMLKPFGIVGDAAEAYADELGLIPGNINTALQLQKTQAQKDLEAWLAATNKRYAYVRVVPVFESGVKSTLGGMTQANGGVVDYYANGGMREDHTAQIAPAGSWRVWAEPETGGEAYIPLAASKRARSLDIWQETGRRLGVAGYASGGIQYASASGGSSSVNVNPQVSLAGATLLMSVDGRQMTAVIQDQIVSSQQSSELKYLRGRQ